MSVVGIWSENLAQRVDGLGGELGHVVGVLVLGGPQRRVAGCGLDVFAGDFVEETDGGERVPQGVDRQGRHPGVVEKPLVALCRG